MQTPIIHTEVNKDLPKKPMLIFNGIMTTLVDQQMQYFNEFNKGKGEYEVEVWDINKIIDEFDKYLFAADLLRNTYFEDIHKTVLSISTNSINNDLIRNFIDK